MTRVTTCPDGSTIMHRPETILRTGRRCHRGHDAPWYRGGVCVVCGRENVLAVRSDTAPKRRMRWRRFRGYGEARAAHEDVGGYLLDLGGGVFGVSDDWRAVARLRGRAWVDRCEEIECWDEVEIDSLPEADTTQPSAAASAPADRRSTPIAYGTRLALPASLSASL